MAELALQHTSTFFVTLFKVITHPFIALSDAIDKQRKINATFNELNALTDRELHDIGIGRSQIMHVAYEYAYGEDDNA
jgi:uncharacterized protein YjiS (DUF1127 family)